MVRGVEQTLCAGCDPALTTMRCRTAVNRSTSSTSAIGERSNKFVQSLAGSSQLCQPGRSSQKNGTDTICHCSRQTIPSALQSYMGRHPVDRIKATVECPRPFMRAPGWSPCAGERKVHLGLDLGAGVAQKLAITPIISRTRVGRGLQAHWKGQGAHPSKQGSGKYSAAGPVLVHGQGRSLLVPSPSRCAAIAHCPCGSERLDHSAEVCSADQPIAACLGTGNVRCCEPAARIELSRGGSTFPSDSTPPFRAPFHRVARPSLGARSPIATAMAPSSNHGQASAGQERHTSPAQTKRILHS